MAKFYHWVSLSWTVATFISSWIAVATFVITLDLCHFFCAVAFLLLSKLFLQDSLQCYVCFGRPLFWEGLKINYAWAWIYNCPIWSFCTRSPIKVCIEKNLIENCSTSLFSFKDRSPDSLEVLEYRELRSDCGHIRIQMYSKIYLKINNYKENRQSLF